MRTRTIHVFKRDGITYRRLLSNATTWGELKEQLIELNYSMDDLTAMDNRSREVYSSPHRYLPEGEFSLFLVEEEQEEERPQNLLHWVLLDGVDSMNLRGEMESWLGDGWREASNGELIHAIQRQEEEDRKPVLLLQEMLFDNPSLKDRLKDFVETYTNCKLDPKDPILGGVSYEAGEAE